MSLRTRERLRFEQRWPGLMENLLVASGRKVRVIEDGLNGRRTACDDPFKPVRNGRVGLAQRIEIHSPLALVILMLGTNDFQSMHEQHLDAEQHATLGKALSEVVAPLSSPEGHRASTHV